MICYSTIPELFLAVVQNKPQQTALWEKSQAGYAAISWQELLAQVEAYIARLTAMGLQSGDHVALISENRREWIVFDLACHMAGIVTVPLHVSLSGQQWLKLIHHADAKLVIISQGILWQKLAPHAEKLPAVYSFDEVADERVKYWNHIPTNDSVAFSNAKIQADSLATILYTSGTTGDPQGVMLTQGNLAFNAQASAAMVAHAEDEVKLNILPFSHAYARTCDIYLWLARGSQLALSTRETLMEDLQQVRPTTLHGVPYLFERIWSAVVAKNAVQIPGALKQLFGGRVRSCSSGGAPLSKVLCEAYHRHEVPLLEGYGLTETSPIVSLSTREHFKIGSCGRPLPGSEVRIADDGELLTRGPHVMAGYYRNLLVTAAKIREGWLYTGDLGRMDEDGFLYIAGRKSEQINLSTGKKVWPYSIEEQFLHDDWISQIVVIGEGRSHLAALVVPSTAKLAELCGDSNEIPPTVQIAFLDHIAKKLKDFSEVEQIKRIAFISPLTQDRGELSGKLSYCRHVISQNYLAQIEQMYRA
jgi:long-chain acyl-CoA synthetase